MSRQVGDEPYMAKTLLEALRLLVQRDKRIVRVFFYIWPGWNTDLARYAMSHGSRSSLVLPKNQNEYVVAITREKLLHYEPVVKLIEIIEPRDLVSLSTRVALANGQERYIPTLDVRLPKSPRSLRVLETFAEHIYEQLRYDGDLLIFESTASYYLVGTELMHLQDMLEFLAFCSLSRVELGPSRVMHMNDLEYLGYTLFKRFDNGLRLMNNMERGSRVTPRVVRVLHRKNTAGRSKLVVRELDERLLKSLGRA